MQPHFAAANLARTQGEPAATTIIELRAQAAVLQAQVTALQNLANRGGGGRNSNRNRGPRNPARPMTHYCWTHGPNVSHNSPECTRQAVGHMCQATLANQMGGNATGRIR
jgi:hypothetical protein